MNYRGVRKLKRRRVVMPYKIRELQELESVIETLIIEDAEAGYNSELADLGDLNYDDNGFLFGFNYNGKVEYDILAVYQVRTYYLYCADNSFYDQTVYLRIHDIPPILRESLIEEIGWEDYSPTN